MVDEDIRKPITDQFKFFLIQVATTLITGVFLALWAAIQYGINYLIDLFQPTGVDQIIFWAFQGIFGVTTLIPVIMFYYVDIRIIFIRSKRIIVKEQEITDKSGRVKEPKRKYIKPFDYGQKANRHKLSDDQEARRRELEQ